MMRVGVSLPIWTRSTEAKVDAAEAKIIAAKAELERERQAWLAALRETYAAAWDAHRRVKLIEDTLLVQARATFDMVRGDYEAERVEFSALLGAVRDIHDLELDLVHQKAARERAVSQWRALLGRPLVTSETDQ